jgi:hypothetical protein
LQDKHNATEADRWHNNPEYERTQFEIDEIDETQVPTEKKPSASIPDFAQLKALPDFDVQLPEGWICKQHSSTVADKPVLTLYYIGPDSKITDVHPWQITAEDIKFKEYDLFSELRKWHDRAAKMPSRGWKNSSGLDDESARNCSSTAVKLYNKWRLAHAMIITDSSAATNSKDVRNMFASGRMGSRKSIGIVILKDESARGPSEFSWVHCARRTARHRNPRPCAWR